MSLSLRPISDAELARWLVDRRREYVESRMASGEPSEIAEANAEESYARLFPGGALAPGHDVFVLVEDSDAGDGATGDSEPGGAVGTLWLGPYPDNRADAIWVWSIDIGEEHRGRGLGRAGMLLAEQEAGRRGVHEIGLNVFGFNEVAIGLYRSLGYQAASMQMRKVLP
jgi:GNAT superfamily N-acetyltransferase